MIKTQQCEERQDLLPGSRNYRERARIESSKPGTDSGKNKEGEALEGCCSRSLEDRFVWRLSADNSVVSQA